MARRERTKHLIELGGLVQKAGLVALADDDRAMLYGALLDIAARMQADDGAHAKALFKRRGARAFAAEAEQAAQVAREAKRTGADMTEQADRR